MPTNTDDGVSCPPIFEIRESQNPNAATHTFGNTTFNTNHSNYGANVAQANTNLRKTQYTDTTPGPPFHISNINSINLNARNNAYIPPQVSAQSGLASSASQDFTPAGFTFHDDNEMDLSGSTNPNNDRSADLPSPATISSQSRGGSTSHSSYSPGTSDQQHQHLPYRASPKPGFNHIPVNTPAAAVAFPVFSGSMLPTSTSSSQNNNVSNVEMFSTAFSTTGMPPDETFNQGFLMGNDWEYGALNASGSGMTPMSDGSWNQMLESVTMGWDGGGIPHGGDGGSR
jgi:hypothetical protein